MARIRTIKPELWQDEDLASVSESSMIAAVGLLNMADDEGYFKANPKLISAAIFPLREPVMSIHGVISELSNIGYISVYNGTDGKSYGVVNGFLKHQKINRPTASKIKDLIDFTESSVINHEQLTGGKERKGKERNREQGKEQGVMSAKPDQCEDIFNYWVDVMGKSKSTTKLTPKRKKVIGARLKDGYTVENIQQAITNCSNDPFSMGDNDRRTAFNDIELICRSGEKLESFISAGKVTGRTQQPPTGETEDEFLLRVNRGVMPEGYGGNDFIDSTYEVLK